MTVKELIKVYDQVQHCKRGYCCEQMIINKGKADLIKLGENSGLYGWNWSAYLDLDTSTLYISNYRNVPNYIKEK